MKSIRSLSFLVLLLGCSMYSYWWSTSDYQWIVPTMHDRVPAAVRESKEFAEILDRPLRVFKRETVASSVEIRMHEKKQFMRIGQFPVGPAGQPNLVCLEYPFVQIQFFGEGTAVSGNKTMLTVVAPCRINMDDHEYLSDVPLPLDEVYRRPAQNQHFRLEGGAFPIDVKLENVGGALPRTWFLERIIFTRDAVGGGEIIIPRQELIDRLGEPVILR